MSKGVPCQSRNPRLPRDAPSGQLMALDMGSQMFLLYNRDLDFCQSQLPFSRIVAACTPRCSADVAMLIIV